MIRILVGSMFALVCVSFNGYAQEAAQTTSAPAGEPPAISQEELDQMLASIALYPDSLLSQILMACTYPLEIVEADRWAQANAGLTGEELTAALEAEGWDPSVNSLVNFPDVLKSLSDNLDWTTKIGDAFLADQAAVMATIQNLRAKAKEAGNLESTEQMTVTTEPAPASSTTTNTEVIVIESPDPEVIYVPAYDPVVVYGTWAYPSYPPPTYYYPPYYAPGSALVGFGVGLACGAAWGWAWGDCDWGGGDVEIDIDRNTNINTNIDRSKAKAEFEQRGGRDGKGSFEHDASHRKGVEYRDKSAADKFGGTSRADAVQSREAYRGRAEQGRQDLARDTAAGRIDTSQLQRPGTSDRAGAGAGAGQLDRTGGANRPTTADRAGAGAGAGQIDRTGGANRPTTADRAGASTRTSGSMDRSSVSRSSSSSAFSGSSLGSSASRASSRGSYSASGGASRSSGMSRSGGASRGGGGRGGGGRR